MPEQTKEGELMDRQGRKNGMMEEWNDGAPPLTQHSNIPTFPISSALCPHCGRDALYDDSDLTRGVRALACGLCGFRGYPDYPARMGTPKDGDAPITYECKRCGDWLPATGHSGAHFCPDCREDVRVEARSRAFGMDYRNAPTFRHICPDCGELFVGGPTSRYCLICKGRRVRRSRRNARKIFNIQNPNFKKEDPCLNIDNCNLELAPEGRPRA